MKQIIRHCLMASAILIASFTCLTGRVQAAISVGASGTGTLTFDTAPPTTEWSTLLISGGADDVTTAAALDTWVIANINAASITTALPVDTTDTAVATLGANNLPRYNSTMKWLQTSPTGVKCNVLMATLQNNSGAALVDVVISYDLGLNMFSTRTLAEEVPGHRVYYSLTGAAGSWTLVPALSTGTAGAVSGSLGLSTPWAPDAFLYVLWVDDNASASRSTSGAGTSEGLYTIDNWRAYGFKKDVAFQQGVDGYTGAVDTELHGGALADTEYSTAPTITCDGSDSGEVHDLIRFNNLFGSGPGQVPLGKTILKATLTLNIEDTGALVNLHRLNKDWAATVTWTGFDPVNWDGVLSGYYNARSADDTEAVFTPDASFTASANGSLEIDMPVATVQAWANGTVPNYGWALLPTGTDGVDWSSSDNPTLALRPKLTITWGQAGDAVVQGITATPLGFTVQITDGTGPGVVNQSTIAIKLDNVDVTSSCTITPSGNKIAVVYTAPGLLASGSAHVANIAFRDGSTPPKAQATDLPFTVITYATIPAEYALNAADIATGKPGFKWRVHQNSALVANNNQRPLDQLAGRLIDPATSLPYVNDADPTIQGGALAPAVPANPAWAPLMYEVAGVIDLNAAPGQSTGYFTPDVDMPGLPSALSGIAGEIVTYLELPAGLITMGGRSDDGFRTSAMNPWVLPQGGIMLGEYEGGSGESLFTFAVAKAGIYAIRTVWEQGTGSAYLELYTVKADGTKVVVNDTVNGGLRAYRETTSPYIQLANPEPGATSVPLTTTIDITLADGSVSKVKSSTIKLWLNGTSVTPTITPGTGITTVSFDPPGTLVPETVYTVRIEYGDDATPSRIKTAEYTFTSAYTTALLITVNETMQWRYSNDGTDQGTAWKAKTFNDSAWLEGPAILAGGESTVVEPIRTTLIRDANGDGTRDIITDYFRGRFNVTTLPVGGRLLLRWIVDDGAIFYINGQEVYRFGAPAGPVTYTTLFTDHEGKDHYDGPALIVATNLVVGENVMAVEVHQSDPTSSDIVFGVELAAVTSTPPAPPQFTNVRREAGGLRLEWTGSGTLQQAGVVTGPYTNAPSQSNPQIVPTPGTAGFYRLKP